MRKLILISFVSILLLLTCVSCSTPNNEVVDPTQEEIAIPEPNENTSVIHGYLLSPKQEPINESIFLSRDLAYDQPGLPVTISFSLQSDPRGFLDGETGLFYFDNVEPGENYVIAIFAGSGEPTFVMNDTGDQPMVFAVEAGETLDLGNLIVDIK